MILPTLGPLSELDLNAKILFRFSFVFRLSDQSHKLILHNTVSPIKLKSLILQDDLSLLIDGDSIPHECGVSILVTVGVACLFSLRFIFYLDLPVSLAILLLFAPHSFQISLKLPLVFVFVIRSQPRQWRSSSSTSQRLH